jgi:hypothetical protein
VAHSAVEAFAAAADSMFTFFSELL